MICKNKSIPKRIPRRKQKKWSSVRVIPPKWATWLKNNPKCDECGSRNEVVEFTVWWSAWGRNCFDFNWSKHTGSIHLCEECESREWIVCYECGALIESDYYDLGGALPEDWDDNHLCPECAKKISPKCEYCGKLYLSEFGHSGLCEEHYIKLWYDLLDVKEGRFKSPLLYAVGN